MSFLTGAQEPCGADCQSGAANGIAGMHGRARRVGLPAKRFESVLLWGQRPKCGTQSRGKATIEPYVTAAKICSDQGDSGGHGV